MAEDRKHYPLDSTQSNISWEEFYNLIMWSPFYEKSIMKLPKEWRTHLRSLRDTQAKLEELFINECYSDPTEDERQREYRNQFEKYLRDSELNPFYVTGYAGVGKSTYINATYVRFREIAPENIKYELIMLDIGREERALPSGSKICGRWAEWISLQSSKMYLFVGPLLRNINTLVLKVNIHDNDTSLEKNLCRIVENYDKLFHYNGYGDFRKIINLIEEYALKDKILYAVNRDSRSTADEKEENSYLFLMKSLIWSECCKSLDSNPIAVIGELLHLLAVLLVCALYNEKRDFRVIITFDNLEQFLGDMSLYDRELVEIVNCIKEFPNHVNSKWADIPPLCDGGRHPFHMHFAFVIVMREVTGNMLSDRLSITEHEKKMRDWIAGKTKSFVSNISYINVSEYFDAFDEEGFLSKMIRFINKHFIEFFPHVGEYINSNIPDDFLEVVFSPIELSKSIQPMYSFNKRRIARSLLAAFSERQDLIKASKYYNDIADKMTSHNHVYSIYRQGGRQIVMRAFLDKIVPSPFFNKIANVENASNVARRALTFLNSVGTCSFRDLLFGVFESPTGFVWPERKDAETLAYVLNILMDTNPDNYWSPLVFVTFNDIGTKYSMDKFVNPTESLLTSVFDVVLNNDREDTIYEDAADNFAVSISRSGETYLDKVITAFEYFAARYAHSDKQNGNCMPLFAQCYTFLHKNTPLTASNLSEWISGIDTYINAVMGFTFARIEKIAKNDKRFVMSGVNFHKFNRLYDKSNDKFKYLFHGQTHPQRILDTHIQYIDDFRCLVLIEAKELGLLEKDGLKPLFEEFSNNMLKVVNSYIKKLEGFATLDDYKSVPSGMKGAYLNYYFGGSDRADEAAKGDDAYIHGYRYYKTFTDNYNKALGNPLDYGLRVLK